jgi:hypothetical protein
MLTPHDFLEETASDISDLKSIPMKEGHPLPSAKMFIRCHLRTAKFFDHLTHDFS